MELLKIEGAKIGNLECEGHRKFHSLINYTSCVCYLHVLISAETNTASCCLNTHFS